MKHIILSDTHAPQTIFKIYEHVKSKHLHTDADAVVINGDILGIFSMSSSNLHKGKNISQEQMMQYLKMAAPNFYQKFIQTKTVTPQMVIEYVQERYNETVRIIKLFAELKKTIFNLGNHESRHHFLVVHELPFLTGCDRGLVENIDYNLLEQIYTSFEQQLYLLEITHDFKYIRDKVLVENKTLIFPVPGESHATVGMDPASIAQENKTKELIQKASQHLDKVDTIIIYNHTQGNYDRATGRFQTASPSLMQFMKSLPANITKKIYVQSHNHWSYTQFMLDEGFHYIMNNAGLHDGIFNMVDFRNEVKCFDIDPNTKALTQLTVTKEFPPNQEEMALISRCYPNFIDIFMQRKMLMDFE